MEGQSKRIGWFEVVLSCLVTAVICVATTYIFVKRTVAETYAFVKQTVAEKKTYQPLVVDFRALSVAQFNKASEEVKARGLKLDQSDEVFGQYGRELGMAMRALAESGAVVFDKNKLVVYPPEIDVTESIAKKLGLDLSSVNKQPLLDENAKDDSNGGK